MMRRFFMVSLILSISPGLNKLLCIFILFIIAKSSAACMITTTEINFGNYDIFSTQNLESTGMISVNCPKGTFYKIALSAGSHSYLLRKLLNGTYSLNYNLYTSPNYMTVWGDGTGETGVIAAEGTGITTMHPIYGRIPAKQNPHTGHYSDFIVAIVIF